jgi:hypothetical protein
VRRHPPGRLLALALHLAQATAQQLGRRQKAAKREQQTSRGTPIGKALFIIGRSRAMQLYY